MQREQRFEKKKAARDKKLEGEMTQVIANSYLWEQFDSLRCCIHQRRRSIFSMSLIANQQNSSS
jgi:hypothetical protein